MPCPGLYAYYHLLGDLRTAYEVGTQFLRQAYRIESIYPRLEASLHCGFNAFHQGAFDSARNHLENALGLYEIEPPQASKMYLGKDLACSQLGAGPAALVTRLSDASHGENAGCTRVGSATLLSL